MENTKESLYTVIKNADLFESLTETERQIFNLILHKITKDKPSRRYYVVNKDEPYAHKVLETILEGEESKNLDYRTRIENVLKAKLNQPTVQNLWGEDAPILNTISFNFTSYPLKGMLELEAEAAINEILEQIKAMELDNFMWKLGNLDRVRENYIFQDIYIGEILIYERKDLVL